MAGEAAIKPSMSRVNSAFTAATRAGAGAAGTGTWINASPLNPAVVGSLSSSGDSSLRTYLDGNSMLVSNSIGTTLSPRNCRVRPVMTSVLMAASFCSPPMAARAAATTAVAGST